MTSPEVTDIFDQNGKLVGTMLRSDAERDNHTIQNVIVFVFNSVGAVWIQKRPMTKSHYPGLWDVSACGGIHAGESHADAAQREQEEEMGFRSELQYVETFMNVFPDETGQQTRRRLSHLYIGISEEVPQPNDEVDEFRAIPHAELRQDVISNPHEYIPSFIVELDKAVAGYQA